MRKMIFGLIVLLPILMSCEEDEDKVIQTDLSVEAGQLFNISKVWNESLYFAMISWDEYQHMDTLSLPSCPEISIDEINQEVTLNFLSSTTCAQTGEYGRSGKIILKFEATVASPIKKWTMEYDDYFFETNSIKGIRTFSSNNSLLVSEHFTKIIQKTNKELNTEFSGKFIHTKSFTGDSLSSFTSLGGLQGKNAVGRDFEIFIDIPLLHNIFCYQQNEILPNTGKENWFVSRSGISEVAYSLTYEPQLEGCKVFANAILPDGRKLLLNPRGD
jgi:hypothetical protein